MARRAKGSGNVRYGVLALIIALVLWGIAHGASKIERNVDIPVVFHGLPDDVVIKEQSTTEINIRVQGSRAALRNVSPTTMEYPVPVEGAKPGPAIYDVEASNIERPQGVRIVSRSPARIEVKFESRARKNVRVRTDIEGEPAEGFVLGDVVVEPDRVWLSGARSDVLRLNEVVTETIDITGLSKPLEKVVRLSLGGGLVWVEDSQPVKVKVQIDAVPTPESESGAEATTTGAAGSPEERKTG